MKKLQLILCFLLFSIVTIFAQKTSAKIDRKAVVERHTVILRKFDSLSSLSVGNGSFAFTVDVTGLQSFPEAYTHGVPLGTQSEWGWHSFPNVNNYPFEDGLKTYLLNGRPVKYAVQFGSSGPEKNRKAADYYRQNLHRLQLANIGLEITKKDGSLAKISDIKNIKQSLDLWTGEIHSTFTVEDVPVDVITYGHQQLDAISVKVNSVLVKERKLVIRVRLPYPTGGWADMGDNFKEENKHQSSIINKKNNSAIISHLLDTTTYFSNLSWSKNASLLQRSPHYFIVSPAADNTFEFTCRFTHKMTDGANPTFAATQKNNMVEWQKFWKSGAAIDFAGSIDKRANELERRIVLSQYLTKIQCVGSNPPQETGLTYNSWYGKPHIEMHWWHGVHFALWGRPELLEKTMAWYLKVVDTARGIARRQGYDGIRWQKMTDNDGREVPSSVGAFLIWQQPHFIYFSELIYRSTKSKATLNKYKELVFGTADFMASFAHFDSAKGKYILGKGVIAAQERFKAEETFNPTYELVYWHWALNTANEWRQRLGLPRNKRWDDVVKDLSPLPVQGDKYLFTESATDSYTNPEFRTDHPSVFGAFGMLPTTPMLDTAIMKNTFNWIWNNWTWSKTWGWDFPMAAMTATRLHMPEKAIDALMMNIQTNTYLPNGHNYQDDRLTIYLPGNGGLLAAIAMMCGGYDDDRKMNGGIPQDGQWKVRSEGFQPMP